MFYEKETEISQKWKAYVFDEIQCHNDFFSVYSTNNRSIIIYHTDFAHKHNKYFHQCVIH